MNKTLLLSALFATIALSACDKPTVVNVPPPIVTPGPPGAPGATGATGSTGAPGKPGEGTTVIITPAASAASN